MDGILVVADRQESLQKLCTALAKIGCTDLKTAPSATQAQAVLAETTVALMVILAPLGRQIGVTLALEALKTCKVLLIVPPTLMPRLPAVLWQRGIALVQLPLRQSALKQALETLSPNFHAARQQTEDAQRLVLRAKHTLMQYLGMTEPQAHRYLEQQAMNLRITKAALCVRILNTYE